MRDDDYRDEVDDDDEDSAERPRRRHAIADCKRMPAGLCGILVGGLGIHKFLLGYNSEGAILLAGSVVGGVVGGVGGALCCLPAVLLALPMAAGIVGMIEGIIYLTMTDDQFIETYQICRKPWF